MSSAEVGSSTVERIRVRYGETDMMGHTYYGNYALFFEQARGAWCRDRGFTYKSLEERGYLLPCVEMNAKFRSEAKYDDWLSVRVWLSEIRRASMRFDYEIVNESTGKVTTEGFTWHVLMLASTRRAAGIPEEVLELLQRKAGVEN